MLERVSSSAECAAHVFLRRCEGPVRTSRNLSPYFWNNGADNIDVPPWWPLYLDNIRNRNRDASIGPPLKVKTVSPSSDVTRRRTSNSKVCLSRTFANSPQRCQTSTATSSDVSHGIAELEDGQIFDQEYVMRKQSFAETLRASRKVAYKPPMKETKQALQLSKEKASELDTVWQGFVKGGWNLEMASLVLRQLAVGEDKKSRERVLRTFSMIPVTQRTSRDYHLAVDVAVKLERYSIAIATMREAVGRNMNRETVFKLLAICVSKGLWNTAADLWKAVDRLEKYKPENTAKNTTLTKRNFAGRYTSFFDIVSDFPSKLVTLVKELDKHNLTLMARKDELIDLCRKFIVTNVESEKVMGVITSTGILALFDLEEYLGCDPVSHFRSLVTLNSLHDKGTRGELALLIYRNYCFRFPRKLVPKWVFRTMLDICIAGKQGPQIYRSLLDDYETKYGTVDDSMYIRVLRACATEGEVEDVFSIFDEFCQRSGPACADDLNCLIRVFAVSGNYRQAQEQFDRIEAEFGFRPNIINWSALLLAFSRSNEPHLIYQKFQKLQESGIKPDAYAWSILVTVAAKRGDVDHALEIVEKARSKGIRPPLPMIGAVVESYLLNNNTEAALSLIIEATKSTQKSGESPIRLWNSLFRHYAFKSNSEAILRTQERMKEFDVKADGMTYAALMTALVIQRRTREAVEILRTLQFSQAMSATEFHYSILLHGFAMENNRDLAVVIYNEMMERFPRATLSAKLSMLYLQAMRDVEKANTDYLAGGPHQVPDFRRTVKLLKESIASIKPSDLASSTPNPGFGGKSTHTDTEHVFLSTLLKFLERHNAHGAMKDVLEVLGDNNKTLGLSDNVQTSSWSTSLETLTYTMSVSSSVKDWTAVSNTWNEIVHLALKNCVPTIVAMQEQKAHNQQKTDIRNVNLPVDNDSSHTDTVFKPFVDISPPLVNNLPSADGTRVLPAHQYVLSESFSRYVNALDQQQMYIEILDTIQMLYSHGFSLSGNNWNCVIQALCRSSNTEYWLSAFEMFEKYLMPNAPSWKVIQRGKWVLPSRERKRYLRYQDFKRKDDRKDRRQLEKIYPGLLMPSYFTVVHLAVVWLKAARSASDEDTLLRRRMKSTAQRTVRLILKTPFLRDKVQGILLRGRVVIGDSMKRPRQPPSDASFAGVQGSRLLIDTISPDVRVEILDDLALLSDDVSALENMDGETPREHIVLPSKGRLESDTERDSRIANAEERQLARYRTIVKESFEHARFPVPLVGSISRGQPPYMAKDVLTHSLYLNEENSGKVEVYSTKFKKLDEILNNAATQLVHEKLPLSARRQKGIVQASSLTGRQKLRLKADPQDSQGLVARPVRNSRPHQLKRNARLQTHIKATAEHRLAQFGSRSLPNEQDARKYQLALRLRLMQQLKTFRLKYQILRTQMSFKLFISKPAKRRLNVLRRLEKLCSRKLLRNKRWLAKAKSVDRKLAGERYLMLKKR